MGPSLWAFFNRARMHSHNRLLSACHPQRRMVTGGRAQPHDWHHRYGIHDVSCPEQALTHSQRAYRYSSMTTSQQPPALRTLSHTFATTLQSPMTLMSTYQVDSRSIGLRRYRSMSRYMYSYTFTVSSHFYNLQQPL